MSWLLKRWFFPEEQNSSASATQSTNTSIPQSSQSQSQLQQETPPSLLQNNQKLLIGGLLFFSLSTFITRRSLLRKHRNAIPPYYTSSVYHKPEINNTLEAFEALNIATINVFSIAMAALGGAMCAFDVNTMTEARTKLRAGMGIAHGVPPTEEEERQFEDEMEEILSKVLAKKDIAEIRKKVEAARAEGSAKKE
ncbi:hypothetical protein BGW36DRAFT_364145 [Talaromyces proteolyticus]|uniref:Altered inheritance of mitochondria protein 11 n=1 Tax=Talaromyces proteolyticus TaxID=1131652 RepID=A0AAD4KGF2_9EURO|nr:uncharacterized protein BGW36DRAFT_364145 [Talaromyces proteolyticus]KAH8690575.1 hypothetical protein BGW36DRAFT_364145 [Talaromyces proteolyticus]